MAEVTEILLIFLQNSDSDAIKDIFTTFIKIPKRTVYSMKSYIIVIVNEWLLKSCQLTEINITNHQFILGQLVIQYPWIYIRFSSDYNTLKINNETNLINGSDSNNFIPMFDWYLWVWMLVIPNNGRCCRIVIRTCISLDFQRK